ncbi:MAG: antibiotic biosynthesis monooxygenase [Verrucomicrobiae bacterium]|nr:antibiotic biosynthesis monooxygenase [Verrucomicrobiae bacterium]
MIAIIVQIKVKPECLDQMLEAMAENAKYSNQEPGCQKWEYSQHLTDPNQLAIYEIYDDAEAVQAHMESEHFKRWFAVAPTLWESKESGRYQIL